MPVTLCMILSHRTAKGNGNYDNFQDAWSFASNDSRGTSLVYELSSWDVKYRRTSRIARKV